MVHVRLPGLDDLRAFIDARQQGTKTEPLTTQNGESQMDRLLTVASREDILPQYRESPIGLLLEYHNLNRPYESYANAQLLIGMCMDNRKHLHIPDNFAFIIRAGGANLRYSEFKVSYAIAVGNVRCIALVGHNECGMVNLISRKEQFIHFAPMFEIGNEVDFVLSEVTRLRTRYPRVLVAPLLYRVEDNRLYLIRENTGSGS
jgi:carbonic anhydrase